VNRDDAARIWVVGKILERMVKGRRSPADTDLRDNWTAGDKLTVRLADGTILGAVTMGKGRTEAAVTDDAALLTWVKQRFKTEIIEAIRPSFLDALLKSAKDNDGRWINRSTGEAETIPGIKIGHGDPYPIATLPDDAEETLARAWGSSEIDPGELLALPGGEQ